jgi:para-nitrobenzyl esterase
MRTFLAGAVAFAALASGAPAAHAGTDPRVVRVETGELAGIADQGRRAFLSIPFAAPPVGPLRYAAPRPAAPWTGRRDATRRAPGCPQPAILFAPASTTEDCLYLNVYTPPGARPGSRLPVMVWLHGGAFVNGSGADYDASALSAASGAVVVTTNYRLGTFGFLALPGLKAVDPALNFGLQDQQAALRWVRRNITAFGGDKDRVTLFGQSAGAVSTCMNMVSPGARGLFQRAILQSASCNIGVQKTTLSHAYAHGAEFAAKVGCADAATQVACLRSKPVATLLAAMPFNGGIQDTSGIFPPVIDGAVLPDDPFRLLQEGRYPHIPVLEGATRDDGRFVEILAFEARTGHAPTETEYAEFRRNLGGLADAVIGAFYPSSRYGSPSAALTALFTDQLYSCTADRSATALSAHAPVFTYQFSDPDAPNSLPIPGVKMGAAHASELLYLFNPSSPDLTPRQQALAHRMIRYWAAFAATGNPNAAGLPSWPRYDPIATRYLEFRPDDPSATLSFGAFQRQHQCLLWAAVDPFLNS